MKVRGNKRKELIDKWLRGEEDSEYEVKPTRKEGKYIIRKRVMNGEERIKTETNGSDTNKFQKQIESDTSNITSVKQIDQIEKSSDEEDNDYYINDDDELSVLFEKEKEGEDKSNRLNLEILKELRLLGEERRRMMERNQIKKEAKYQVAKRINQKQKHKLSLPQQTLHPQSGLSRHRLQGKQASHP